MKPLAATAALLALACAVTIALAQDEPAPEPKPQPAPKELTQAEKEALATRAYFVLRNRCWGCHGEPGKTAYGETVALDWILDYDKLVEAKLVIPGKVKESRLIYLTTLGKMPREFDENGKPSKEGELPESEQKALLEWVKSGAPKWPEMKYSHEWVTVGRRSALDEAPMMLTTHDGVARFARSKEGKVRVSKLHGADWESVAWPEHLPQSVPVASLPTNRGTATYFVVRDRSTRETVLVKLDRGGFVADKARLKGVLQGISLHPGRDGAEVELIASGRTELSHGGKDEYFVEGVTVQALKSGQWVELDRFFQPNGWHVHARKRDQAGEIVLVAAKNNNSEAGVWVQTGGDWKSISWPQTAGRTRASMSLSTDGSTLGAMLDDTVEIREFSATAWPVIAAYQPYSGALGLGFDNGSSRWIACAKVDDEHQETWALIPWRKAQ